jgi:hypothetical protein
MSTFRDPRRMANRTPLPWTCSSLPGLRLSSLIPSTTSPLMMVVLRQSTRSSVRETTHLRTLLNVAAMGSSAET